MAVANVRCVTLSDHAPTAPDSSPASPASAASPGSPFADLAAYVALPRVESLTRSPDGRRVVLTVATLDADGAGYERALWEVDAAGGGTPRRLTRSTAGESGAAFTGGGTLLFTSSRTGGGGPEREGKPVPQLWSVDPAGGEARPVTALAGGVSGIAATARAAETVVLAADILPSATTLEDDARLREERAERKVAAILHEHYPVRVWDHDLGPDEPHLLALDLAALAPETVTLASAERDIRHEQSGDAPAPYPAHLPRPADLTPHPGRSADTAGSALTPDGRTLVAALRRRQGRGDRFALVAIDVATGAHTTLVDEPSTYVENPTVSHDGAWVAYVRSAFSTPAGPADQHLWVARLDGSDAREVAVGWDRWPAEVAFAPDDRSLVVVADDDGRGRIFRVPLDGGDVIALTTDDHAYTQAHVGPDGSVVALRSSWQVAPHPVRVEADGTVTELATPAPPPAPVGTMTDVETVAEDGSRVRGWLLTPPDASAEAPAPLLLWIHGGPLNSWNAWSWRWCAQLLVARGYAVLLPDPALSTGYGLEFIARGWNAWGGAPYTDLMAITDAVEARPEIDEGRTAAMGGSFGGYMANWVAGHTDRFRAIVTHASLWALDQFRGTTDGAYYWDEIFDDAGLAENSPHQFVEQITTPLLVIHGDRDYRVPIGEGNRLWAELAQHHADEHGVMPHRYLYFPDENHWVLKPQHATVWYETVMAFLAQHVLGEQWERPDHLG